MANISIADNAGLTANLEIRDDSPLAKAGLTRILSTATVLAGSIDRPVGETDIRTAVFGGTFSTPSTLIGDAANLAVEGGANAALSVVKSADQNLFGDDPFAPVVPIDAGECWVGFEIDASLEGKLAGTVDGFGVAAAAAANLVLATYSRVPASAKFLEAVRTALANYTVACTVEAIRNQPAGTVTVSDLGGTLTFSGSYALPISVNALASANHPFNYKIEVNPALSVEVAGSIAVTGDFLVRSHKISETELRLGVYKKKGTTLSASLSAGAGIAVNAGDTDLLAPVLDAVLPGVDAEKAGAPQEISAALQEGLERNLSIALNVECSAATTHEAAVVYLIDLAGGDTARTDAAVSAALNGDWTRLDALANARALRNIVKNTKQFKHKFAISLLGIYNALSIEEFVQSCTILHDENGHIVITDTARASRIAAASRPFAADADKLRSALAEAFLATVTYTAGAGTKLKAGLSVSQTYFRYKDHMAHQEMKDAVLLARVLGRDVALDARPWFRHARIAASARYDNDSALRLFFADPSKRQPHTRAELERAGRETMLALIDRRDPAGEVRRRVLSDDAAWSAMDETGNTAQFAFLPALRGLGTTELGAVSTDWVDIVWWADAMDKISRRLAEMLDTIDGSNAADPTRDPAFAGKQKKLAGALGEVTRKTHAAFVGGWGLAVMFALSQRTAEAQIELASDSHPL